MRALQRRITLRQAGESDAGFTLVEVLVALIILVLVFASTAVVIIKAANGSAVARQHQAAAAYASGQVEKVRALSNALVVAGSASAVTADPLVTTTSGVSYYEKEALALNTGAASGTTPLNTYPWPTLTSNNTTFTVKTFVTCKHTAFTGSGNGPACGSTVGKGDTILYHLTVLVTWVDRLGSRSFKDSSYLFSASPTNACQPNLPIAAPCQSVLYAAAGTGEANVTLTPADANTGGVKGVALTSASLTAGDADAAINAGRTTTIDANANGGSGTWDADSLLDNIGGTEAAASASDDPAAGAGPPTSTLSQAAVTKTYNSDAKGNVLKLTKNAVTGDAVATASATTTPVCTDPGVTGAVVQQTNALPCADSSLKLGGATATVTANDDGAALGSWNIVSFGSSSKYSNVWAGRMSTAFNGHCASPGLDGCIASAADRTLGTLSLGAAPTALKSINSTFSSKNYLVRVSSYTDSATSESGVTASSVPAPAATGTLTYWNGTGYTSTSTMTGGATIPLSFSVTSNGTTLTQTGTITSGSVSSASGIGTCTNGCTATSAVRGMIIDLTYTITVKGVTTVSLQLHADLGGVTTSATYQSSPSAS